MKINRGRTYLIEKKSMGEGRRYYRIVGYARNKEEALREAKRAIREARIKGVRARVRIKSYLPEAVIFDHQYR